MPDAFIGSVKFSLLREASCISGFLVPRMSTLRYSKRHDNSEILGSLLQCGDRTYDTVNFGFDARLIRLVV